MADFSQIDTTSGSGQVLKSFQLTTDTKSKSDPKFGKHMAQYFESQMGGNTGYFFLRNVRYKKNRDMANGRVNIRAKFGDLLDFNGKTNFVNLLWKAPLIVNTIITKLVGGWMGRNEKIVVKAIDPLSVKDKQDNYEQAEFVMNHQAQLQQLQDQTGVPMIPPDQFVPEDKEDLETWFTQSLRLPEEILYEEGTNDIFETNGWFGVLKEKLLHDSAETGFVGTYTWMDEQGVIHVDWVKPENAIYTFSEYPDFRDTTMRGQVKAMKISTLRRKYGKEFGGKLTEEQIWEIAQQTKDYQLMDKITWLNEWSACIMRPYDEWNFDVLDFEVKSLDSDPYTIVTTKKNKSTLVRKGQPAKPADNEEYVEDKNWNIYRGVYARSAQVMLEWGLKTNMIRPQDPKEIGNAEFSYSFYMYQNNDMRNIAIPEKVEEPVDQMTIARLKIQQLVAKMAPAGYAIDVDALQELDLGLASMTKPIEQQKIHEQTGRLYYRGRDAEGNQIHAPITELANSGFLAQMQGLITLYNYHFQVLKDELGEDPNIGSQALKPRVTSDNVEQSLAQSDNATNYCYNAYLYVMEDTSRKVACLLKNSVTYGASVYRHIIGQEDVKGRIFSTVARMLPTEAQIQRLDAMMNQAIASNPQLILYLDPFKILRVAQEDFKLGEVLFLQAQKRAIQGAQQQAAQNAQENAKQQVASAQAKSQGDMELQKTTNLNARQLSEQQFVQELLTQSFILGKPLPPEQQALVNQFYKITENDLKSEIQLQELAMQQAALAQHQQEQEQQEGGQPEGQEAPQEEQQEPQPQMQ